MGVVSVWDDARLAEKQQAFRVAGRGGMCVVSDWDRTLTYPKTASGLDTTSYLAIVHGGYLGDGYRKEMAKLYVKYRGAELDGDLAETEKLRLMNEWWLAALDMLKHFGLSKEMIADVGTRDVMVLRDGVAKVFATLTRAQIPLQIVSAGLGDVIVSFLEAHDLKLQGVDVVANWLHFDAQGMVVGCNQPIIHSANKTQLVDMDTLRERRCVLVLGDTFEDADMVADFEGGTVLRVGFLNEDTEDLRDDFMQVYDVVIDDGDFEYVHACVKDWIAI